MYKGKTDDFYLISGFFIETAKNRFVHQHKQHALGGDS
jgi:hypothetical protein